MAASGEGAPAASPTSDDAPDADWLRLTEGMDDYERFRFIARHVLLSAIDEARGYATDERIFPAVDDPDELEAHLASIDERLREDASLSAIEQRFLCTAVADAMDELELEASCPWQDLARLGAASRDTPTDADR